MRRHDASPPQVPARSPTGSDTEITAAGRPAPSRTGRERLEHMRLRGPPVQRSLADRRPMGTGDFQLTALRRSVGQHLIPPGAPYTFPKTPRRSATAGSRASPHQIDSFFRSDMLELLSRPWPWYIAGPLIGLMVPIF